PALASEAHLFSMIISGLETNWLGPGSGIAEEFGSQFALSIYHRIAPLLIDSITRIRYKCKASARPLRGARPGSRNNRRARTIDRRRPAAGPRTRWSRRRPHSAAR